MKIFFCALILAFTGAAQAQTECSYPAAVDVPAGASATEADMDAGQKRVKTYMASMQEYLDCMDAIIDNPDNGFTPEERTAKIGSRDAAVTAMESVAAQFNAQVRAFKTANP